MKKLLLISIAIVSLQSCSTDFDIIADYEDITVVYALLSQNDSVQYVRISKAFLGQGNAYDMAKIPDSIYYPSGTLEVWVERWQGGRLRDSYLLEETTMYNKEPGIFSYPEYPIWKFETTDDKGSSIREDSEYHLTIINKNTGKETRAVSDIVYSFYITKPFTHIGFVSKVDSEYKEITYMNPEITWGESKNAKSHEAMLRFYYGEYTCISGACSDTIWKFIDMKVSTPISPPSDGIIKTTFSGGSFYTTLAAKLEANENIQRIAGKKDNYKHHLDIIVTAANEALTTYISVSKPATGINQEKPDFTNITNGIGVFGSRCSSIRSEMQLSSHSQKALEFSETTKDLRFQFLL